jgi:hypothetical protein
VSTLRLLLIQRAARLQERPALTAPEWGTLSWSAWRNRVEGIAFGLLAGPPPPSLHASGRGPWDWAAEVATACCGARWEAGSQPIPEETLGGPLFNAEAGRGPYHDLEVLPGTPFTGGFTQQELVNRLRSWNGRLGWDHTTVLRIAPETRGTTEARAALWCALYAGGHTQFAESGHPVEDLGAFKSFWSK